MKIKVAQNPINITPRGIVVRKGQIWRDCDFRTQNHTMIIDKVEGGYAFGTRGKRRTRIKIKRMYPHSRGWQLIESGGKLRMEKSI